MHLRHGTYAAPPAGHALALVHEQVVDGPALLAQAKRDGRCPPDVTLEKLFAEGIRLQWLLIPGVTIRRVDAWSVWAHCGRCSKYFTDGHLTNPKRWA